MSQTPPPALLCEVTRGGYGPAQVESRHVGHAVVVNAAGEVLFSVGNPDHPTFPRSSLKPLQALAGVSRGVADRFDLSNAEVAVMCASHAAEPRHREAVARILERIGAQEDDLYCGPHPVPHLPSRDELILAGRQPTRIYNNCSGKHAGMLALARLLGAPLAGYWEPEHPVQQEVMRLLGDACAVDADSLRWGKDGCGVPAFQMPLRNLAMGFARLCDPTSLPEADRAAAQRITDAMNAEPEMVRGEGGYDSVLMRALPGLTASKGGAEGCQCIGLPGKGIGIAVKVEDGSPRPLAPVTLAILRHLGVLPEETPEALRPLLQPSVENTRGDAVGEVRATLF